MEQRTPDDFRQNYKSCRNVGRNSGSKKKFTLLSELLLKLCTSRNVRNNFKDLTSLILLFLNIYKKNYPIDIYSADTKESQLKPQDDHDIKRILRQELISSKLIQWFLLVEFTKFVSTSDLKSNRIILESKRK